MNSISPTHPPIRERAPSAARPVPLLVRGAFRFASTLAPSLVGAFIANKMFTPRRQRREASPNWPTPHSSISIGGQQVVVYQWTTEDTTRGHVLLVHGWEGRADDWRDLVGSLRQSGYQVTAFDAPAHGASTGVRTDVHDIARTIAGIVEEFGKPSAIVAHSIGAAAAAVFLDTLATSPPDRLVLLAPGGDLVNELEVVGDALGLGRAARRALQRSVESRYGKPAEECSTRLALADLATPTLLIHDEMDRVVPIAESDQLASSLTTVDYLRTSGLGHRKLLRDGVTIDRIINFLGGDAD